LPLQFNDGDTRESLGLTGTESFSIRGLGIERIDQAAVTATRADGSATSFSARVRIDTPKEQEYFVNGGILHYVLRQLANSDSA
jgi:aconitate hydratase